MTEIIIVSLLAFTAWREWQNSRERKDLYNRLMARDLTDYRVHEKAGNQGRPPPETRSRNTVRAGIKRYFERLQQESGD